MVGTAQGARRGRDDARGVRRRFPQLGAVEGEVREGRGDDGSARDVSLVDYDHGGDARARRGGMDASHGGERRGDVERDAERVHEGIGDVFGVRLRRFVGWILRWRATRGEYERVSRVVERE